MSFKKRRDQLRKRLKAIGTDCLLITNITNVRYLTGFTGSAGYLVVARKTDLLLSDSRYETQIADECPDLPCDIRNAKQTMLDTVVQAATSFQFKSMAFEAQNLSKAQFDQFESAMSQLNLVGTSGEVEKLRAIKDRNEVALIRKSIDVNQRAFEVIKAQLTPDQSEQEIAFNLEHQMRKFGATGFAFPAIVGVGERAALPHGVPGETNVSAAPFLLMDWGANVDGYLSDLTRMIIIGKINAKFRKIYNTVLKAQLAAIEAIRPGVDLKSVDRAARSVIEKAGYGAQFGHGTGHSFGLEIHELPYLSPIHEGKLEAGMVVTVEPGIYLPGFAGVRIEDDVLVTKNGHEVLSNLPKELELCRVHLGG